LNLKKTIVGLAIKNGQKSRMLEKKARADRNGLEYELRLLKV
jgi:hypothetical protein